MGIKVEAEDAVGSIAQEALQAIRATKRSVLDVLAQAATLRQATARATEAAGVYGDLLDAQTWKEIGAFSEGLDGALVSFAPGLRALLGEDVASLLPGG